VYVSFIYIKIYLIEILTTMILTVPNVNLKYLKSAVCNYLMYSVTWALDKSDIEMFKVVEEDIGETLLKVICILWAPALDWSVDIEKRV